ncbi:hypothetical protein J2S76_003116 [Ancylobacter vacuolatus]|uniref:Uncharacterized protein n=1 Tax=Ancylobacter vacuolatus TaxID=223389 RepID=A0ABU0DJT2_9HYPH|nr:hypothetical protein [Ancylobacter vacuolatus]
MTDDIAADLLAEKLAEFATVDWLEAADTQQHQRLGLGEWLGLGGAQPGRQLDRIREALAGAVLPAAGNRRQLIGPAPQLGADVVDDEVEIAVAPDHARQRLAGHRDNRQLLGRRPAPPTLRSWQDLTLRDRTSHRDDITPTS